jgi:hypothetical protein
MDPAQRQGCKVEIIGYFVGFEGFLGGGHRSFEGSGHMLKD